MTRYLPPPTEATLAEVDTERLHLRRFRESDLDGLAAVMAEPEFWRFPYGRGFDRSETKAFLDAAIDEWEQCGFGCWVAIEKASDTIIGYLGLSVPMFLPEVLPAVEVGWRLDPNWWGQGLATEGASAALREGFVTLGLSEITSVPQAGNPASERVAERIGMRFCRRVVIPATERRGELDGLLYVLTRDEWRENTS